MTFKQILHRLNRRDTRLLPKNLTLSKIILILLAIFTITFATKTLLAQTTLADEFKNKQASFEKGNNAESWILESISSNVMVGINTLAGTIPDDIIENKTNTTSIWIPGGILGTTHQVIASLYNQPISGVEYIAQAKNNFLGKPVYAESGFQGLSPLIPIWKTFRNASYVLFSIIFIFIGLMIMFRVKISPQATITIQNAIPKIITSLVLVTFSYAIAGLLIDLSKVIEGFGISLLANSGQYAQNINVSDILKDPNYLGRIWGLVPWGTVFVLAGIVSVVSGVFGLFSQGLGVFSLIGGWQTALLGAGKNALLGAGIVILIALILIIWYTVKLCFGLLKCYLNILISVILSPLEISLGAIPNMKIGFNSWFINIFANILVFPIVTIFLVLIEIIKNTISNSSNMWMPNGISGFNILATGTPGGIVVMAISLGGIIIASKLPTLVPEIIFQIKPSGFGKAIGESIDPYGKAIKGGAKYGTNRVGEGLVTVSGGATTGWRKTAGKVGNTLKYFTGKH